MRTTCGRRKHALLLGSMVALALAGGCSKESATPAATTPSSSATSASTVGPPTTAWAGAPNPCSLLTDTEIRAITNFEVNTERVDSRGPDGGLLPNCRSQNVTGAKGGYFTVTVIPPGSAMLRDRSQFTAVEELPGVGQQAVIGHHGKGLGAGTNIALVDMGNGGFLLGAQVYSDVTSDQMKGLVKAAAGRWPAA